MIPGSHHGRASRTDVTGPMVRHGEAGFEFRAAPDCCRGVSERSSLGFHDLPFEVTKTGVRALRVPRQRESGHESRPTGGRDGFVPVEGTKASETGNRSARTGA